MGVLGPPVVLCARSGAPVGIAAVEEDSGAFATTPELALRTSDAPPAGFFGAKSAAARLAAAFGGLTVGLAASAAFAAFTAVGRSTFMPKTMSPMLLLGWVVRVFAGTVEGWLEGDTLVGTRVGSLEEGIGVGRCVARFAATSARFLMACSTAFVALCISRLCPAVASLFKPFSCFFTFSIIRARLFGGCLPSFLTSSFTLSIAALDRLFGRSAARCGLVVPLAPASAPLLAALLVLASMPCFVLPSSAALILMSGVSTFSNRLTSCSRLSTTAELTLLLVGADVGASRFEVGVCVGGCVGWYVGVWVGFRVG